MSAEIEDEAQPEVLEDKDQNPKSSLPARSEAESKTGSREAQQSKLRIKGNPQRPYSQHRDDICPQDPIGGPAPANRAQGLMNKRVLSKNAVAAAKNREHVQKAARLVTKAEGWDSDSDMESSQL